MRKQVNLKSKKSQDKKPPKETFFFFVKDQGEGAARVVVIILKVLELILTTIYGLVLGIFAPLIIRGSSDLVDPEICQSPAIIVWLAASILYIIGMFTVMLGKSKIATGIHLAALVGTLVANQIFAVLFRDFVGGNPLSGLYLPCVFITILTMAIMLIINIPKVLDAKVQKENAAAPSIFDKAPTRRKK